MEPAKKKVNDFKNERIKIGREKKNLIGDLFPQPYGTLCMFAKSNSGKTNLLTNIIKRIVFDDTNIIVVSTTANVDPTMIKMISDLSKFYEVTVIDDLGNSREFTETMQGIISILELNEEDKYKYPKTILILDDLRSYLRLPIIKFLLTKVRHFKTFLIISCHSLVDIDPESRENLFYLVLFKKNTRKRLETVYDEFITSISFDDFQKIYHDATKDDENGTHNFLFLDVNREKFRKNLNEEYLLEPEKSNNPV